MNVTPFDGRRYRILELIGRGGFGNVYRARLEGPSGFVKDVAVKIVRGEDVPASEIARFRDEARILGLVRDRAIVAVDPPVRLGGSFALVMEYIDGCSAHRLVTRAPLPPRVALEIVGEIARVLHKVYHQRGPDGAPLHLLHRDLKPANVQITPEGDVKLLDFGIARARFDSREAQTSTTIGGTAGYIAPERLRGMEGPEGDIYSLGVLLRVLVTTERAKKIGLPDPEPLFQVPRTPEVEAALGLSERMRAADLSSRPTAQDVEAECARLVSMMSGPSLRSWARETVPHKAEHEADDLVGSVLTESVDLSSSIERSTRTRALKEPPKSMVFPLLLGVAGLLFAALGSVIAVAALSAAWLLPAQRATLTPEEIPAQIEPEEIEEPVPEAVLEPVPDPDPAAVEPVAAVTRRTPRPQTTPEPAVAPASPEPVPAPAPEPGSAAVEIIEASFRSDPEGAEIFLGGISIGRTPLASHPLSAGTYELRFVLGDRSITRTVRVGGHRGNKSFIWRGEQLVVQ